ncbi:hypothetical protein, partial [Stenotrophomonas maltophilia]|uniref:hypothetical protein n=1 Tax=Stenotrophomonas maltophilia TaxID=40324 RepID=UPI0039C4C682
GIHAADTPATGPTPPSTVFRELSEWQWGQIRFPSENGSDPFLFSDTPHPRMAWKTNRHREIVGSGEGADGGTVHGMDAVAEPTGTYLRRVPPSAPSPPNQQKSRAAFEVVVAVA